MQLETTNDGTSTENSAQPAPSPSRTLPTADTQLPTTPFTTGTTPVPFMSPPQTTIFTTETTPVSGMSLPQTTLFATRTTPTPKTPLSRYIPTVTTTTFASSTPLPRTTLFTATPVTLSNSPTATTGTAGTNNIPFIPSPFSEPVGPNVHLNSSSTALDAFLLLFSEDTFQLLADQTNLYASQVPPGQSYKWYNTTANKMKLFIGMILAMGIHQLPQLEDYWSNHPLLGAKGIVAGMSYRHFRVLLSCLHLVDNTTAIPRG